jgi:hypothetical protein
MSFSRRLVVVSLVMGLAACASSSEKSGSAGSKSAAESAGKIETKNCPSMNPEKIRDVIRKHLPEIQQCYITDMKENGKAEGRMILEWDIEDGGKVTRVETVKTPSQHLATCATSHLRTWKFPAPKGQCIANVRFPFYFSPTEKARKN